MNSMHSREAFILGRVFALGVEDIGTNDGREILEIHLAPRLFVDVREGRHPLKEDEDDLHRVAVVLWHETANQVHDSLPFSEALDACNGQEND